jgi:hypothetical protein
MVIALRNLTDIRRIIDARRLLVSTVGLAVLHVFS